MKKIFSLILLFIGLNTYSQIQVNADVTCQMFRFTEGCYLQLYPQMQILGTDTDIVVNYVSFCTKKGCNLKWAHTPCLDQFQDYNISFDWNGAKMKLDTLITTAVRITIDSIKVINPTWTTDSISSDL